MQQPSFDLGKVTITTEALCALAVAGQDADFFLQKHASGDRGEFDPAIQEQALREWSMVVSRFRTLRGKVIIVATLLAKGRTSVFCEPIVDAVSPGFTYDHCGRTAKTVDAVSINHGFPYDAGPVIAGYSYASKIGPMSRMGGAGYPPIDALGLIGGTIDPGPAPNVVDPVNLDAFKYDGLHQDCGPWPPWYKTGQPEPKKPDPGKPKEEQP